MVASASLFLECPSASSGHNVIDSCCAYNDALNFLILIMLVDHSIGTEDNEKESKLQA